MTTDRVEPAASEAAAIQDVEFAGNQPSKLPPRLQQVSSVIWKVVAVLGSVSVLLLLLTVVANVLLRVLVGQGILGANDLVSSWWMVSIVFLGIALAQHTGGRIQVDFLMDGLTGKSRRVVDAAALGVTLLVGLALAVGGWLEAVHQMSIGEYTAIAERLIWPFRFLVPISFLLFSFACVLSLIQLFREPVEKEPRDDAGE